MPLSDPWGSASGNSVESVMLCFLLWWVLGVVLYNFLGASLDLWLASFPWAYCLKWTIKKSSQASQAFWENPSLEIMGNSVAQLHIFLLTFFPCLHFFFHRCRTGFYAQACFSSLYHRFLIFSSHSYLRTPRCAFKHSPIRVQARTFCRPSGGVKVLWRSSFQNGLYRMNRIFSWPMWSRFHHPHPHAMCIYIAEY